jgi:hypothetical protein
MQFNCLFVCILLELTLFLKIYCLFSCIFTRKLGVPIIIWTTSLIDWLIDWLITLIDWLIDYLRFYVPLKNFSLIWRRHHCRWRVAKFRPMLGAQSIWAGRNLYRATLTVTRDLGFSGFIRRTAPFSHLLRHVYKGVWSIYSSPDPHGDISNFIQLYDFFFF